MLIKDYLYLKYMVARPTHSKISIGQVIHHKRSQFKSDHLFGVVT